MMHSNTNIISKNNKLQTAKTIHCGRCFRELFTCDRDFLREVIWADWSDCSWSDRICLIFSFSMATVLKADFSREWTATRKEISAKSGQLSGS